MKVILVMSLIFFLFNVFAQDLDVYQKYHQRTTDLDEYHQVQETLNDLTKFQTDPNTGNLNQTQAQIWNTQINLMQVELKDYEKDFFGPALTSVNVGLLSKNKTEIPKNFIEFVKTKLDTKYQSKDETDKLLVKIEKYNACLKEQNPTKWQKGVCIGIHKQLKNKLASTLDNVKGYYRDQSEVLQKQIDNIEENIEKLRKQKLALFDKMGGYPLEGDEAFLKDMLISDFGLDANDKLLDMKGLLADSKFLQAELKIGEHEAVELRDRILTEMGERLDDSVLGQYVQGKITDSEKKMEEKMQESLVAQENKLKQAFADYMDDLCANGFFNKCVDTNSSFHNQMQDMIRDNKNWMDQYPIIRDPMGRGVQN